SGNAVGPFDRLDRRPQVFKTLDELLFTGPQEVQHPVGLAVGSQLVNKRLGRGHHVWSTIPDLDLLRRIEKTNLPKAEAESIHRPAGISHLWHFVEPTLRIVGQLVQHCYVRLLDGSLWHEHWKVHPHRL